MMYISEREAEVILRWVDVVRIVGHGELTPMEESFIERIERQEWEE